MGDRRACADRLTDATVLVPQARPHGFGRAGQHPQNLGGLLLLPRGCRFIQRAEPLLGVRDGRLCNRLGEGAGFHQRPNLLDFGLFLQRPGYQEMLAAARAHEFEVIVCEDTWRLWRNLAEQWRAVAELLSLSCRWKYPFVQAQIQMVAGKLAMIAGSGVSRRDHDAVGSQAASYDHPGQRRPLKVEKVPDALGHEPFLRRREDRE